jgi:GT2 family glycosyltransferase
VPRIDVLMTSHNRRAKTLACLASVEAQAEGLDLRVVLVDAGSTDGTREAVSAEHPSVELVPVGPQVFWGQGMRAAGQRARADADFHLWLNDDVVLAPDAVAHLLRWGRPGRIVVGKLLDDEGRPTYGGLLEGSRGRLATTPAPVSDTPLPVDSLNGNVVLVGHDVVSAIGPVRGDLFPHAFGDIDYGFTARDAGFEVLQAPGTVGWCSRNAPSRARSLPTLRARWRALTSTKELPPRVWWRACRRHGGVLAPVRFALPYAKLLRRRPEATS